MSESEAQSQIARPVILMARREYTSTNRKDPTKSNKSYRYHPVLVTDASAVEALAALHNERNRVENQFYLSSDKAFGPEGVPVYATVEAFNAAEAKRAEERTKTVLNKVENKLTEDEMAALRAKIEADLRAQLGIAAPVAVEADGEVEASEVADTQPVA